jgi:hypothetical protein
MFRTGATALNQDLTPWTAATQTGPTPIDLRLRWNIRNGQLQARSQREPHVVTEGRAWMISHVAA